MISNKTLKYQQEKINKINELAIKYLGKENIIAYFWGFSFKDPVSSELIKFEILFNRSSTKQMTLNFEIVVDAKKILRKISEHDIEEFLKKQNIYI